MNRIKCVVTAVSLVLLGCTHLQGTTVVVVRTPEHFVVAADSLWTGMDPRSPSRVERAFFCKIMSVGHLYFVATTSEVDARQLMTFAFQAMKTSATAAEAAQKLADKSDQLAKRTAEMVPQSTIDSCFKRSCSEALFLEIEKDVPTMVHLDFVQEGNSRSDLRLIPHTFTCPGKCPATNWDIFFLGQRAEIARMKRTNPNFVKGYSDQEVAQKLVDLEEKADPDEVGGPIDVLTIDKKGAHWEPNKNSTCSPTEKSRTIKKPKNAQ